MPDIVISSLASSSEQDNRKQLFNLFSNAPLPESEVLNNVGLFQKRQELSKILFFNELYKQIVDIHGVLIEFGTRWGQNMVLLNNLRGIYEPYNYNRRLLGFDTFEGFVNIDAKDGADKVVREGNFSVTKGYQDYLDAILDVHEKECPLSHIRKNFTFKGDATVSLRKYLADNPQTMIAFAWFDFDIYTPTKECLELIAPHLSKGSIVGFDELNDPKFPGETIALAEFCSLNNLKVRRNRYSGMQSYIVWGD